MITVLRAIANLIRVWATVDLRSQCSSYVDTKARETPRAELVTRS